MMGIEHERIHLETSSVLIRQLPIDQVVQLPFWDICTDAGEPPENELVQVPGGMVTLGKSRDHPLYGWDNEYGSHEAEVSPFTAARYLVSNREFLEFVEAGGYGDRQWWTEEGWNWREFRQAEHPAVLDQGRQWLEAAHHGLGDSTLPWNWPVEVNYLEAKAFCNWKAARPANLSACRPRTNGTACGMSATSRPAVLGQGSRQYQSGVLELLLSGGPVQDRRVLRSCSAMSGSGPKPPSTPSTVSRSTPGTTISPPPPSTPGTT